MIVHVQHGFIFNSQNISECGNEHSYEVVCDIERGEAAVLDCHCVTYDLIDRLDPPILDCASTTVIAFNYNSCLIPTCIHEYYNHTATVINHYTNRCGNVYSAHTI